MNSFQSYLASGELLSLAAKASMLIALALLALRCLPRHSSALRFTVVLSSLIAVLLLPMVSLALPRWQVLPNLVAPPASVTRTLAAPIDPGTVAAVPTNIERSGKSVVLHPVRPSVVSIATRVDWPRWLLRAWLAGMFVLLARTALSVYQLRLLYQQSVALTDTSWLSLLADARQQLGVRRNVALRLHPDSIMPMTFGVRRSIVLLPLEAEQWTPGRRRNVLLHELAHIKRNDLLCEWICRVACIVHWFNPLVWLARRTLIIERERACDDMVIATGSAPADYAQCLLQTSVDCQSAAVPCPCMARRSDLEIRMMSIMDRSRQRGALSQFARGSIVALSVAALLPIAALALDRQQPARAPQPPAVPVISEREPVAPAPPAAINASIPPSPVAAPAPVLAPLARDAELFAAYNSDSVLFDKHAVLDTDPTDGLTLYDLLDALHSDSPLNRAAAAKALANQHDPQVLPALVNALGDPDTHVREWAARSLGDIGDPGALPALAVALNDPQGEVGEWAARSLGGIGNQDAVDALVQSLTHQNASVREWSARSLGDLGNATAVDGLIGTLQDRDAEVREWALRALGDIGDPRALGAVSAFRDDPNPDIREWSERVSEQLRSVSEED